MVSSQLHVGIHLNEVKKFVGLFFVILLVGASFFVVGCERKPQSNQLTFGTERAAITLDPRFNTDTQSENAIGLMFNGLLRVNEKLEFEPDLATSYEASEDARKYTFHLRKGVTYHDGTKLKASDVVYTFRFLADEKNASPFRSVFRILKSVEAVGEDTIQVELTEPNAFFPDAARRPVIPQAVAEKLGTSFAKSPIGTGPFRLVSNRERDGLELEAFPQYFGGKVPLPRLHLRPILDTNVRLLELMKGSIDIIQETVDGFPPGSLEKLQAQPGVALLHKPSTNISYLNLNLKHPILKNRLVREAIARAINRSEIIRFKFAGFALPATGLLPPNHWAYEPHVETYDYDPAKAKALLDQAGFIDPDGPGPKKRFKLIYRTSTKPQAVEIAQVIAGYLEQIGIGVELSSRDFGVFFDDIKKGNFDLYSLQWTAILTPDHYYEVFHSKNVPPLGLNRNYYANPKLDNLLEAGRRTTDREKQKAIYSEVQKIVAHDLPCVPLWNPQHIAAYRTRVENYVVSPRGTYDSFRSVLIHD